MEAGCAVEKPLAGIRVIELASWAALPGGGAILADWGAEVLKIEDPRGGDPTRGFSLTPTPDGSAQVAPIWEQNNRGKKSIALDGRTTAGRDALRRLVARADVFMTSSRPLSLERQGLSYAALREANPRLIYVHLSGYGPKGDDSWRPGFDMLCFWARAGIAKGLAGPGQDPINQRPAMGDHAVSIAIAGAVSAALFQRERTGEGQFIQASLYHTGLWINSVDVVTSFITKRDAAPLTRWMVQNPLVNSYKTKDGWIQLVNLQSDRFWQPLCRAVGRPDLAADARYAGMEDRARHGAALVAAFAEEFAKRTIAEWGPLLDAEDIRWGRIQSVLEATQDPQAQANGYFQTLEHPEAGSVTVVTSPIIFGDTPPQAQGAAPLLGRHTEEVLLESGFSWEEMDRLKSSGAIL